MKIKRYKKAEKYMSFYKNNFGFWQPYQVLLDGTFCQVALAHQVNIQDQLPRYLGGQCKLLTTACVIEETKRLGKPLHGAYLILSQYPVHDCGHEKPVSASKCLSSFIIDTRNKDHYIIATQDHRLRLKIAKYAVCPLLKLANNALVLDKPSQKVLSKIGRTHHFLANKISDEERDNLARLKTEEKINDGHESDDKLKKKRKKQKGPNPLSCKKKSKTSMDPPKKLVVEEPERKKRRRKKVHIAKHVRELLQLHDKDGVLNVDKPNE